MSIAPKCQQPSTADLQEWMAAWIAAEMGIDALEVGFNEDFEDMGLSSIQAISFAGDLEERTGNNVDPSIAWEYPNIEQLTGYLTNR